MGCKYCERKPVSTGYEWRPWENEEILESGCYTQLKIGVDGNSRIYLAAYGDDDAIWYPNFCPVCGRPLRGHRRYTAAIEDVPYGGI